MGDNRIGAPSLEQAQERRPARADAGRRSTADAALAGDADILLQRRQARALRELRGHQPTSERLRAGLALQMQRSFGNQHTARAIDAANVGELARRGTRGASTKLPFLDRIQSAFGHHDVRHVRAHFDREAGDATRTLGAEAFTVGDHVAFAGAASLHTAAHEAAHVVQQRAGVQLKRGIGEAGDVYERHADAVADRVVRGESAEALLDGMAGPRGPRISATQAPVQCKFGFEIETRMLVTQAPVHAPTNNAHQEPRAESGRIGSLTQGVDLHKDHHIDLSSLNIDLHGFPEGPLVELVTSPPLDETMPEQEIRAHMRGMRAFADDAERLSNNFRTPFPLDQIPAVATVVAQAPGNQLYIGGLLPHQHTVGYTQATFGVRTSVAPEVFREMQRDENVSAATQKEASLNRAHMDGVLRRAERVMNAVVRFVRENHDEASDQALRGLTGLRRPLEPGWKSVTSTPQRLSLDKRARRIGLPVIASPPTGWQSSPDGREYLYDRETLETLGWADEVAAAPATHYKLNRVTSTSSARPFARTLDEKLEGLEPLRGLVTMMANYLDLPFATNTDINLKNAIGQLLPKSALHTVRNAMQGYSRVLIDDPEVQGLIVDELMKGAAAGPMNMDGTLRTIVAGQGDDFHRALMSRGASQAINDQRVGPGDGESAVVIENRQLQPPGGVPSGRGIYDRLPALGDKRRWKADHLKPDEWEEVAVNLYRWLREINGYNIVGRDRSNAFSGVDEFLRRRDT